ncbi:MAG: TauD/TfdA family dioxygenase [Rhodospirillaceae bacterium]|nr:TauD/TfdA family dioxygenase [Rhodospirillaceae bacterium]MBL6941047.1 TauD/TfdA family dioxygenase [Rhodospirillales bacterium]
MRPDSFDLDNDTAYVSWRDNKLSGYPESAEALIVEVADFENPTAIELAALRHIIAKTNMALYSCKAGFDGDVERAKKSLDTLAGSFGLSHLDANLCADEDAITPLSVAEGGRRGRYIPYTNRPISWHTDGYYNKPEQKIRAMILHCINPAADGGVNALMDPEIAYIRMRDANPDFIRALMHPDAMLIPANDEGAGVIRAAQGGPVFSCPDGTSLHMRYTARTRSIAWRDDTITAQAIGFLSELLAGDSPYIFRHRMAAGEGVLCNNVLHNRAAFEDDEIQQRLILRARYFDRIAN